MTNEDKDKKEYELGTLLKSESDLAGVVKFATDHGAELVGESHAKRVALSYEIDGITEATFAYFNFRAHGDEVKAMEQDLNNRPEILRSLLVIATPPNEHHSPLNALPGSLPRRGRPLRAPSSESAAAKPVSQPLSNEALEKKIEEILK